MNVTLLCSFLSLLFAAQAGFGFKYPASKKEDVSDDYHGQTVKDPYRWLEDNDSQACKDWIESQNKLSFSYLASLPSRAEFQKRLTELWDYDKFGVPEQRGSTYFYTKLSGLQNQPVLYFGKSPFADDARALLDPNKLSLDATTSLAGKCLSDDGKLLVYGMSAAGSDWSEWKARDVESGRDFPDELKWIKFTSCELAKDGKTVYYSRYPQPQNNLKDQNFFNKLYSHQLGTEQSQDKLLLENEKEKDWEFSPEISQDGRFLVVSISRNTNPENLVYVKDLSKAESPFLHLVDSWGSQFNFVDNEGTSFIFQSNHKAPRGRIIAIDLEKPQEENWRELHGQESEILRSVQAVGDKLLAHYLKDAHSQLKISDRAGKLTSEISLPAIGSVNAISGRKANKEAFYSFQSFTEPPSIYRIALEANSSKLIARPKLAFDPAQFECKQVFIASKDGTKIPVFIVSKKGLELAKKPLPTLLYAYGGFNIPLLPSFNPGVIAWLEKGGIYVQPCLRGGGEYGEEWHKAGMKENKQNVFDDFISTAEWLIEKGYASKDSLAVTGRSNGGLLIGAVMTQRPELFKAAIPEVGVLDMLRYHKFTIGHAWSGEYGSADDASAFKYLMSYSPLHNLKKGRAYPATLITTGDHDDRVFPAHSFKFAASLQDAQMPDAAPVMIRIESRAGHGAGKPTAKIIEEAADKYCFAWEACTAKN